MTRSLPLAAAVCTALLFAPATAQEPVTADTVVARIGDVEITMGHVLVMRQQLPQRILQLPDDVLLKGIVDQLVDQYLLSQSVDVADLPANVALQLENERRGANAAAALQLAVEGVVTPEALEEAYQTNYVEPGPALEYNAAHILLETEEAATEVVGLLNDGGDFAELAQERSTGPSGPRGGDLGWFGDGVMDPTFFEAVQALEVGGVSPPVETRFGWHVITLKETRELPIPSLEEVQGNLAQELQSAAIEAHVAGLRETAAPDFLMDQIDPSALRDDSLLGN